MLEVTLKKQLGDLQIDAAFQAEAGVTVLFGPSGAGKSSILSMISGLLKPDSGSVVLNGRLLEGMPPESRRVGHVFQDSLLFPHLSVQGNLLFGAKGKHSFDAITALMGIEHLLDRKPRTLSGGEAQRVAIARALLSQPDLLLMDEPMASLDAARKERLLPYLKDLRRQAEMPVIYVTHSVDEAFRLGDRIVLIEDGKVIDQGPPDAIFAPSDQGFASGLPRGGVLHGTVRQHLPDDSLTELDIAGNAVFVRITGRPPGENVRLRLDASDIALSLEPPQGLSILNRLSVTIEALTPQPNGDTRLRLALSDGQHIAASVTARAVRTMDLKQGTAVFALFKSVALTPEQVD